MGFVNKITNGLKLNSKHLFGRVRKNRRKIVRHLHLTGKSKVFKGLKKSLRGLRSDSVLPSYQPTSASSYQHQSRTLSQLTGGV